MAQTFKFGKGTWANKKGSTLAYNDENENYKPLPFNFTRASIATRVNKAGLVEVVGQDKPRIDYTDSSDGSLLLESGRTNLVTYSEDFNDSSWTKLGAGTGSTAIVTNDYATSPDGTQNASRLQCDLNGGVTSSANQSLIYDTITGTGETSAFIYVKSNTSSSQKFYLANSLNDQIIGVATTEWKKFELNWTASGNGRTFGIGTRGTSNSDDTLDLLIWGAQVEAGSFSSSYIPTNGSAVTRAIDIASESGNSEVFNNVEGTIFIDTNFKSNSGVQVICCVHDFATNKRLEIWANSNLINGFIGGSSSITVGSSNIINGSHKIALSYKSGNSSFYVDGFLIGSSSSTFTIAELTKMTLGYYTTSQYLSESPTKEVGYYNTILTDSELETLTSYRNWVTMVNELNLNIIYNG